jgi:hypothetical protein
MPHYSIDCGHCGRINIGAEHFKSFRSQVNSNHIYAIAACRACGSPNIVVFRDKVHRTAETDAFDASKEAPDPANFPRVAMIPERTMPAVPEHLPAAVQQAFDEAIRCVANQIWNAAGMSARRAIDVSTKSLGDEYAAITNMNARINKLGADHRLTPDLVDWTHHVRLEGNDANHEIEPYSEPEARELVEIARYILTYLFTLPGMIAAARARPQA